MQPNTVLNVLGMHAWRRDAALPHESAVSTDVNQGAAEATSAGKVGVLSVFDWIKLYSSLVCSFWIWSCIDFTCFAR